jgi:hypothetical protein
MSALSLRLGHPGDAPALARLQLAAEPDTFTSVLGAGFLRAYYAGMLAEPHALVVVAAGGGGRLAGAVTGSLDTAEHLALLRRRRPRLLAGALATLVTRPGLVRRLRARERAAGSAAEEYVITHGARMENWMWDPARRDPVGPLRLIRAWLSIAWALDAAEVRCEVNAGLPRVERLHRALGAGVARTFTTPDGVERTILRYPRPDVPAPAVP